jgi:hypothetical protein
MTTIQLPTGEGLKTLLARKGVRSWELEEVFQGAKPSQCLGKPIEAMTPSNKSRLTQWLIEMPPGGGIRLAKDLIEIDKRIIYEINPLNQNIAEQNEGLVRVSLPSELLKRITGKASENWLPPAWPKYPKMQKTIEENIALLCTYNNHSYYHMAMVPGMSVLHLQEHFDLETKRTETCGISYRSGTTNNVQRVSELLEICRPDLKVVTANRLELVGGCLFSMQMHHGYNSISPSQIKWWKQKLHTMGGTNKARPEKFFISRQGATKRRCKNESELIETLACYGFVVIRLEELSVKAQIELFRNARVIIGTHGAGFTNIINCNPGTTVIELVPQAGNYGHYYLMSEVLGLRHAHVVGYNINKIDESFVVDSAQLLVLLNNLGCI